MNQTEGIQDSRIQKKQKRLCTKPTNLHSPDPDLSDPQNGKTAAKKQQTTAQQHQEPKQKRIYKTPTL